jgi:hypothetical protein
MKNLLIIFVLLGIFSCKKKKETEEEPPPVVTPARTNTMTARVNGTAWAVAGNQTSSAKIDQSIDPTPPKKYVFIGRGGSSMYQNAIHVYSAYITGTVDLGSGAGALYFDATGGAFYSQSGTMTITAIDTSHAKSTLCDKFAATFSFVTSPVSGISYTVDQGSIDFEAP